MEEGGQPLRAESTRGGDRRDSHRSVGATSYETLTNWISRSCVRPGGEIPLRLTARRGATTRPRWYRSALILALTVGFALRPAAAHAHAAFVSSQPEPGQRLGSAPGVVALRFSEPLNQQLSRAVVTAPDGTRFEGRPTGAREIRVSLSTNAAGVYEVGWTTVSTLDGHTLRGSFRFGVGVSPGPEATGTVQAGPQPGDLLIAVARAVEYLGLLLALGMMLVQRLARKAPELTWARPRLRAALALALGGGLAVVSGEAILASGSPSGAALLAFLTTGSPGPVRALRVGLEALALATARRASPWSWALTLGAVGTLAAAGHAAAVSPAWWGMAADAIHLLAAGLWAGGILALATIRPPEGWRGPGRRELLRRFSPAAVKAFLASAGFGAVRALQELGSPRDLVTSSYGRALAVKVALVALMLPLSLLAWRRLRAFPRAEGGLAVLVVAAAALLAAYPLPPARLAEAKEARAGPTAGLALPRPGDLTMGGHAGQVLVGLTIRPGRPGPNDVLVYLLPLEGEEAARSLVADLEGPRGLSPLGPCGSTCRRARLVLAGGEELEVVVRGARGGRASFRLPPLPAPDGSDLLARMQERIHRVRSYRVDEVLSTGLTSLRTRYEFQAPDRMRARLSTGAESLFIGDARYARQGPGRPWEVSTGGPGLEVPSFTWDFFQPLRNARILGRARAGGTGATVVGFFGMAGGTPVWFRVWVTPEFLVRRAEMRAIGHFMDHRYFDYDRPIRIQPPVQA